MEGKVHRFLGWSRGATFGNTYQTVIDASKGIFVPVVSKSYQMQFLIVIWSMIIGLSGKPKYAFVSTLIQTLALNGKIFAEAEVSEAE